MNDTAAELLGRVEAQATRWFAERPSPGMAWSLFRRGELLGSGMLGSAVLGGPAPTERTAFRIASISKSFLSATVLALRDRGELTLDTPVTEILDWIDGFRLPPGGTPPTLRMLLSMSGGLTTDDPWADRLESMTTAEFRAMVNRGVLFGTVPGTAFAYSNLGYALLGQVVETITGQSVPEAIGETLLRPLGLQRTGFDTGVGEPLAVGYAWANGGWQPLPYTGPGAFSAIGGLFSTTADLARWADWLSTPWQPGDESVDPSPLSAASRRELAQVVRPIDPDDEGVQRGYGLGLRIEQTGGGTVVSHSGGYPGWSAHLRFHPASGLGLVALANATHSFTHRFCTAALAEILPEAAPVDPWPETTAAQTRLIALLRTPTGFADGLRGDWVSDNLLRDSSGAQRQRDLDAALAILDGSVESDPVNERSSNPSHQEWDLPVGRGLLRCRITLNPLGQLQALQTVPIVRGQV